MRAFVEVGLVFCRNKPRDWLGERLSNANDLLLCLDERKTLLTRSLGLCKAHYRFITEIEVYHISVASMRACYTRVAEKRSVKLIEAYRILSLLT